MKDKSTVYIVTSVHNSLNHTKVYLESIHNQRMPYYKIIVVDDGSSDGTDTFIRKFYPEAILIRGNGKLWWTGGINLGILKALEMAKETDFILTMNNDSYVESTYLSKMIMLMKECSNSIVGSVEIDSKTKKISGGRFYIDWKNSEWINLINFSEKRKSYHVDWLSTKGTIFPVRLFREIGLLDEVNFPHYASDVEFTSRAKFSGYNLVINPIAYVYSDTNKTGISYKSSRNSPFFTRISELALSRSSTINIVDHFNLIRLVCPRKYRLINYFRLLIKTLYIVKTSIFL